MTSYVVSPPRGSSTSRDINMFGRWKSGKKGRGWRGGVNPRWVQLVAGGDPCDPLWTGCSTEILRREAFFDGFPRRLATRLGLYAWISCVVSCSSQPHTWDRYRPIFTRLDFMSIIHGCSSIRHGLARRLGSFSRLGTRLAWRSGVWKEAIREREGWD